MSLDVTKLRSKLQLIINYTFFYVNTSFDVLILCDLQSISDIMDPENSCKYEIMLKIENAR